MIKFMAAAACAAILAVACGGDSDDDSPTATAGAPTSVVSATSAPSTEASPSATAAATATTVSPTATQPTGPKTVTVELAPSSYSPSTVNIAAGDTVTWHWNDGIPHSVTSSGGFDSDPAGVKTEGTYSFTFRAAGTFAFFCQVHQDAGMTGQVVVQ